LVCAEFWQERNRTNPFIGSLEMLNYKLHAQEGLPPAAVAPLTR